MIFWLIAAVIIVILMFGLVIFVGPPYLPTFNKQITVALRLLDLQPGETLLELGSGDGRVMRAAAKRGLKVVGIEVNPLLVLVSLLVTLKYRKQVRVIWGSYWGGPWPRADGIFTFMLPKYMGKLSDRIEKWCSKDIKLASFAFAIPNKEYVTKKDGVFLYEYKVDEDVSK